MGKVLYGGPDRTIKEFHPPFRYQAHVQINHLDNAAQAEQIAALLLWGRVFEPGYTTKYDGLGGQFTATASGAVSIEGGPQSVAIEKRIVKHIIGVLGFEVDIQISWSPLDNLPTWSGGWMPDDWCQGCGRSIAHMATQGLCTPEAHHHPTTGAQYCDKCWKKYGAGR
jgi:hypothetical protein